MSRQKGESATAPQKKSVRAGTLYVVATPIGNLEDITLRALRILKEVDLIASEDTRHTRKLLSHFGIRTSLISYYKEKEVSRAAEIISEILAGKSVALVSDAGTPAISDPGDILVGRAYENSINVVPIPGPSALAAIISICGLNCPSHIFLGFLPSKANERRKLLVSLRQESHCLVFYESPRRIEKTLADCEEILGNRVCAVGRELTKLYEEMLRGSISDIRAICGGKDSLKGEFVAVVQGFQEEARPDAENFMELLVWYRDNTEFSMRDAVKRISKDLDLSRNEVYRAALGIWGE